MTDRSTARARVERFVRERPGALLHVFAEERRLERLLGGPEAGRQG